LQRGASGDRLGVAQDQSRELEGLRLVELHVRDGIAPFELDAGAR